MFRDNYAPRCDEHQLAKIKGPDVSLLSPSRPELYLKNPWTNFLAYVWTNAYKFIIKELSPTEYDWRLKYSQYKPRGFKTFFVFKSAEHEMCPASKY